MARAKAGGTGETLLDGIRNSPETKRLAQEARHLFEAQTGKLTTKLGDGVSGVTDKLTSVGESGSLPSIGAGAKRLLNGDGPLRAMASGVAEKAKNAVGGKNGSGGEPKAINIEESIDIGVPVSVAYDQWTQFEEFSRFTKGVENVEQVDDTETEWRAKVFKSRRSWKSKILEQVPDRRIVWTSDGDKGWVDGVVTFHPLADDLTRVLVALEYYPNGLVEKTGNLWRAAGRRTRLDLKNFRRFVMLQKEPTGAWRGEIREGKVVKKSDKQSDKQSQRESSSRPKKSSRSQRESSSRPKKSSRSQRESSSGPKKSSRSGAGRPSSGSQSRSSDTDSPPRKSSPPTKRSARKSSSSSSSSNNGSSGSRPAKATARKSAAKKPAAKAAPAKKAAPRKSSSESRRPRKSTKTSESRRPRKSSTSAQQGRARKSTSQRSTGSSGSGSARKSTSGPSRARKQPAKKTASRKRTSK
jgi:uncharacterized membrane protein